MTRLGFESLWLALSLFFTRLHLLLVQWRGKCLTRSLLLVRTQQSGDQYSRGSFLYSRMWLFISPSYTGSFELQLSQQRLTILRGSEVLQLWSTGRPITVELDIHICLGRDSLKIPPSIYHDITTVTSSRVAVGRRGCSQLRPRFSMAMVSRLVGISGQLRRRQGRCRVKTLRARDLRVIGLAA